MNTKQIPPRKMIRKTEIIRNAALSTELNISDACKPDRNTTFQPGRTDGGLGTMSLHVITQGVKREVEIRRKLNICHETRNLEFTILVLRLPSIEVS